MPNHTLVLRKSNHKKCPGSITVSYNKMYYFQHTQAGGISISSSFILQVCGYYNTKRRRESAAACPHALGGVWGGMGGSRHAGTLFFAPLLDTKCYCTLRQMPCNIQSETHCLIPFGNYLTCTVGSLSMLSMFLAP